MYDMTSRLFTTKTTGAIGRGKAIALTVTGGTVGTIYALVEPSSVSYALGDGWVRVDPASVTHSATDLASQGWVLMSHT